MIKIISYEKELNACKNDGRYIENIQDPSEEMMIKAINQNWISIIQVKHPTETAKRLAISKNFDAINIINKYCGGVSDDIILEYFGKYSQFYASKWLEEQSDELVEKIYNLSLIKDIL